MDAENDKVNFFSYPLTFLFTNVVFPLLALGALGYVYWISTEALTTEHRAKFIASLVFAAALPAIAAARLVFRRGRIGWGWLVALALAYVGFFFFAFPVMNYASWKVDGWIVSETPFFAFWLGVVPPVFAGIARIATIERKVSWSADLGQSLLLTVGGPLAIYVLTGILRSLYRAASGSDAAWRFIGDLMVVAVVIGGILLFIGFCRVLWLLGRKTFGENEGAKRIALTLIFCLALPLGGLALNLHIPFPADFANPWPWALSILTTLVMLPRQTASARGLALWWGRFTVAPFVFYFFILFVPFLPLAVLAVLMAGAGFLILAPTFLLRHYTAETYRAWQVLRTRYSKRRLVLLAVLGALVLPAGFAIDVEIERAGLKALVKWHTEEDFDAPPAPLPVSKRQAERIVKNANDFADGAEIPFLSAWRTFRVYDGLYMADSLRQELNLRILGKPVDLDVDDWRRSRNAFGAGVFGMNPGRRRNRNQWSRWTSRPPRTNDFEATCESKGSGEYLLKVHAKHDRTHGWGDQEFIARFRLPAGTWIEGMRLKMDDGTWKDAKASERKAAEFVYRHITEQRRDPSIITLDTPTTGVLKIFPVGEQGRDVEITLRTAKKVPFVKPIWIGERKVRSDMVWIEQICDMVTAKDADVTLVSAAWMDAHTNELESVVFGEDVFAYESCGLHSFSLDSPTFKSDLRRHLRLCWKDVQEFGHGVMPSFEFTYHVSAHRGYGENGGYQIPATNIVVKSLVDLPKDYRLPESFLTTLRREFPGVEAFGDRPLDGWYALDTEDGGKVAVPYRKGEGALVFAKVKDAWVEDGKWSEGAKLWAREREAFLKPALDLRKELLDGTRATGVLTTQSAYLAVETSAQEKALKQKEMEALYGDKAFDFEEPPATSGDAPGMILLLVFALPALYLIRRRQQAKMRRRSWSWVSSNVDL